MQRGEDQHVIAVDPFGGHCHRQVITDALGCSSQAALHAADGCSIINTCTLIVPCFW